MLPNWSSEAAAQLLVQLRAIFGTECSSSFEHSVHTGQREVDRTKFEANFRHADKSVTTFETDYSTGFYHSETGLPHVRFCVKRKLWVGDDTVYAGRAEDGEQVATPEGLAGWVVKVKQWSDEVDAEFTEKVKVAREKAAAKERAKKRRVVLANLVAEDKLSPTTLKSFSYDPGDKRSCGSLEVLADSPKGELRLELVFGSSGAGEPEDFKVTLN